MEHRSAVAIWKELEAKGARVRYRPVTQEEVDAAEQELSVSLPPSYVELVRTLGAPAVLPRLPPRSDPGLPENLDFTMLTPGEIVERTYELRASLEPALFEDPASVERVQDQLDECVLFQLGLDAGEGFVFLLDTGADPGEMVVADYSQESLEELDWDPVSGTVWPSFAAAQAHVAEQIIESWTEYADA